MPLPKQPKNIPCKIAIKGMCLGTDLQIHKIFYGKNLTLLKFTKRQPKRKGICVWLEMSILLKNKFLNFSRILNKMCKFILNLVLQNKDLQRPHAKLLFVCGRGEEGYPFQILRLKAKLIITRIQHEWYWPRKRIENPEVHLEIWLWCATASYLSGERTDHL